MYSYVAYGLRIDSEIELPELTVAPPGLADVHLRVGPAPIFTEAQGSHTFSWDEVGTFVVSEGRDVWVSPRSDASDALVRLPILGPVLGTLLQQRGQAVLHASAVDVDGLVVAFIGAKGAGKSTTAASLNASGAPLVTDDLLPVACRPDGNPAERGGGEDSEEGQTESPLASPFMVWPGFPQLKLWPESAAAAFGDDPATLQPLHERVSKTGRRVGLRADASAPLSLSRIYVLDWGPVASVQPLRPADAFLLLVANTYTPAGTTHRLDPKTSFEVYSKLATSGRVRRLARPVDLSGLSHLAEVIAEDVRAESPSLQGASA